MCMICGYTRLGNVLFNPWPVHGHTNKLTATPSHALVMRVGGARI